MTNSLWARELKLNMTCLHALVNTLWFKKMDIWEYPNELTLINTINRDPISQQIMFYETMNHDSDYSSCTSASSLLSMML